MAVGRVLVAGDVHGRFGALSTALELLEYDEHADHLVLLGDIINKGPDSHLSQEWLHHHRVLGNHEASMMSLSDASIMNPRRELVWLNLMGTLAQRRTYISKLLNAPVMLEITTPYGRNVGFMHGCVPFMDWNGSRRIITDEFHPQFRDVVTMALTDRDHALGVFDGTRGAVRGIDHVFLGHTPRTEPTTTSNTTLVDTSRNRTNPVTVLNVDQYIDLLNKERTT